MTSFSGVSGGRDGNQLFKKPLTIKKETITILILSTVIVLILSVHDMVIQVIGSNITGESSAVNPRWSEAETRVEN